MKTLRTPAETAEINLIDPTSTSTRRNATSLRTTKGPLLERRSACASSRIFFGDLNEDGRKGKCKREERRVKETELGDATTKAKEATFAAVSHCSTLDTSREESQATTQNIREGRKEREREKTHPSTGQQRLSRFQNSRASFSKFRPDSTAVPKDEGRLVEHLYSEETKRDSSSGQCFERSKEQKLLEEHPVAFDGFLERAHSKNEDLCVGCDSDELLGEGRRGREVERPGSLVLGGACVGELEKEFCKDSDWSEEVLHLISEGFESFEDLYSRKRWEEVMNRRNEEVREEDVPRGRRGDSVEVLPRHKTLL